MASDGSACPPLALAPAAAAHEGSVHAGVSHWALLALLITGLAVVDGSAALGRTRWARAPRRTVTGVLLGTVVAMVGTVGLVEFQVEPSGTTSGPTSCTRCSRAGIASPS